MNYYKSLDIVNDYDLLLWFCREKRMYGYFQSAKFQGYKNDAQRVKTNAINRSVSIFKASKASPTLTYKCTRSLTL